MARQTSNTFLQLRDRIDSNDPFMSWGHQIAKTRTKKKNVPAWVDRPSYIQTILLKSFPRLLSPDARDYIEQRERAARWARVIQLYFKLGMSRRHVAEELGEERDDGGLVKPLSMNKLCQIIKHIRRAGEGKRADNTRSLGGKNGRPKKT